VIKKYINRLIVGPVDTNCFIYFPEGGADAVLGAALIDPGAEPDVIIDALGKLSLVPRHIVLTHGHFDHIGALAALASFYKNYEPVIAIHRLDAEYLGPGSLEVHRASVAAAMGDASIVEGWDEPPAAGRLLEDGDVIGPFTVLHLPGHTPGSAAFWDKEAGVMFTGDTLFMKDYGRTDLPGGDGRAMRKSLRRLFAMDGKIEAYPGHGASTLIGREAARVKGKDTE
jgi:glyoxylase-like metal-dependent hydrolase (beta-lactamase superfamily II)